MNGRTRGPSSGRGSGWGIPLSLMLAVSTVACDRNARASEGISNEDRTPRLAIEAQPLDVDPCGWLTPAEVSGALARSLRGVPVRISSAESITPSSTGRGCLYELQSSVAGGETVAIELKVDGAELQAGLGAVSMGMFASDANRRQSATWDWIGGLPVGLFAARQGHLGVLIAIGGGALTPSDVEPLAAELVARVRDVPFFDQPGDLKARSEGRDPCSLITREEAERVMGPLVVPPYRSHEGTPLVHGNGGSCTYFGQRHRAVVVTPTWSEGRMTFGLLSGVGSLTRMVTGEEAVSNTRGPWDDRSSSATGSLSFLKGDQLLEVQHRSGSLTTVQAEALARVAMPRLPHPSNPRP